MGIHLPADRRPFPSYHNHNNLFHADTTATGAQGSSVSPDAFAVLLWPPRLQRRRRQRVSKGVPHIFIRSRGGRRLC